MSRLVPPTAPAPSSSPKEDWDASDSEEEEQATAWEEADPPVLGRLIEEDPEPADQGVPRPYQPKPLSPGLSEGRLVLSSDRSFPAPTWDFNWGLGVYLDISLIFSTI